MTEIYTKSYEFFYSPALDTCIADMYESLHQPSHKDYFMRMALIDTITKHFIIDFRDPDDEKNFFYVSKEEYEGYGKILREGTRQELEKYKESMTKDSLNEAKNR